MKFVLQNRGRPITNKSVLETLLITSFHDIHNSQQQINDHDLTDDDLVIGLTGSEGKLRLEGRFLFDQLGLMKIFRHN